MKRYLAFVLSLLMILTSGISIVYADPLNTMEEEIREYYETIGYVDINDDVLLRTVESSVYNNLVYTLDSDEYFIEDVSAIYLSDEYLEELAYNSQENIFFGYKLSELNEQFQDKKYVFTLGEDGTTIVKEFEDYDHTFEKVVENVAIGTGIIFICVTVTIVTGGTALPAVNMIFATAAKSGTVMALSSGAIGGFSAGIVTGIETGNFDEAIKAGAVAGSENFKWGAIIGTITGGSAEAVGLKRAAGLKKTQLNGLTMNQAAAIQKESRYPLDVIGAFKNVDQYNICKEAGLVTKNVNGKAALIRYIDLNFVDDLGRTNLERMTQGLSALDPLTGMPYELHHIGQKMDSTLAILTKAEHMQGGNNKIWHEFGTSSEIDRKAFEKQKRDFWKAVAEILVKGI